MYLIFLRLGKSVTLLCVGHASGMGETNTVMVRRAFGKGSFGRPEVYGIITLHFKETIKM